MTDFNTASDFYFSDGLKYQYNGGSGFGQVP